MEALQRLYLVVTEAYAVNPLVYFEVFIHKVDGLSEDHKIETQREIQLRIVDELNNTSCERLYLHLTSIYDHSIFEAFSKVIQKLTTNIAQLENLLNLFCLVGDFYIEYWFREVLLV